MKKYKKKYRTDSNRLKGWDYSNNGYYFITLVTAGKRHIFGEMCSDEVVLSDFGTIARNEWLYSFVLREELLLDKFVFMPNHLHAVVILQNTGRANGSVETHGRASLHRRALSQQSLIRKPRSISSFIAGYKSSVIRKIDDFIDENGLKMKKYNKHNPLWQANYYDHIIRDEESYTKIFEYIVNNPCKWYLDSLNPENQRK